MKAITDLYYGNIHPNERMVKAGSEYQKLSQEVLTNEKQVLSRLDKEGQKQYRIIIERMCAQMDIATREGFIDGFRLGARFMMDVLNEAEGDLLPLYST